ASPLYVWVQGLDHYKKVLLIIRKWAKPYRRARVTEVDFGVIKEYGNDELIKINLIEEINVIGDTLPANELKFTIDNSTRQFNILNPDGFYRFLAERQEIELALGIEIFEGEYEYIGFKRYYLIDWQVDEGALTATFTARNLIELLSSVEGVWNITGTLYDLAQAIMEDAGVPEYWIDPKLQDIPTRGFSEKMTARDALQCIGLASKATVYQDRYGVLQVRQFETIDDQTSYMTYAGDDLFAGPQTYMYVDSGLDMKNINFDNVYSEPKINLDKIVKSLTIVVYESTGEIEYTYQNVGVREGEALKLENPLIQSKEHADNVAEWILREYNLRAHYTVNWRQNPCLECGDVVIVEDSFGAKKQSRIIKQEFEFAGYLLGRTETKGGV